MALTDWGETPAPQNLTMVKQALLEKARRYIKIILAGSKITAEQAEQLNDEMLSKLIQAGEKVWMPLKIQLRMD